MVLRLGELLPGVFGGLACVGNDIVGARQHILAVDVDNRMQRPHLVVAFDPLAECFGIGFYLFLKRCLHFRCGIDRFDGVCENFVRLLKLLACNFALRDAVVGLMVPHRKQSHHQFCCVCLGQPRHIVVIDGVLYGVSRHLQIAPQAHRLVKAESMLIAHHVVERLAQRSQIIAHT